MSVHGYTAKFDSWKHDSVPWPLAANRWHHNQFVPSMLSYTAKGRTLGNQRFEEPLLLLPLLPYPDQKMILLTLF